MVDRKYIKNLHLDEKKYIIKKIIPEFIRLLYKSFHNRKRYPDSYVSCHANLSREVRLGKGVIVRSGSNLSGQLIIGNMSTLGNNSNLRGGGKISIGNFCSIASNVSIISENHDFSSITTFPLELYKDGKNSRYSEFIESDITIGNDVWIGQGVIILAGAKIGDGCVIAAGSIVPQNTYEPYSIIAGNPGRVIKKRFDSETISKLTNASWYLEDPEKIFGEMYEDLHAPVTDFVKKY